jgi:hypothetical protein
LVMGSSQRSSKVQALRFWQCSIQYVSAMSRAGASTCRACRSASPT